MLLVSNWGKHSLPEESQPDSYITPATLAFSVFLLYSYISNVLQDAKTIECVQCYLQRLP
jgi:hypothetical protein